MVFKKTTICSTPILANPILTEQFLVDTDASNIVNEEVFSQTIEGEEHVIVVKEIYASQENNYWQ